MHSFICTNELIREIQAREHPAAEIPVLGGKGITEESSFHDGESNQSNNEETRISIKPLGTPRGGVFHNSERFDGLKQPVFLDAIGDNSFKKCA